MRQIAEEEANNFTSHNRKRNESSQTGETELGIEDDDDYDMMVSYLVHLLIYFAELRIYKYHIILLDQQL